MPSKGLNIAPKGATLGSGGGGGAKNILRFHYAANTCAMHEQTYGTRVVRGFHGGRGGGAGENAGGSSGEKSREIGGAMRSGLHRNGPGGPA